MSYPLSSFSDQPKDTPLCNPIALTEFGGGCPSQVLCHQPPNGLTLEPLPDPTSSTTVRGGELNEPAVHPPSTPSSAGFNLNPVRPTVEGLVSAHS